MARVPFLGRMAVHTPVSFSRMPSKALGLIDGEMVDSTLELG